MDKDHQFGFLFEDREGGGTDSCVNSRWRSLCCRKLLEAFSNIGKQEVAGEGPVAIHNRSNDLVITQRYIGVVDTAVVEDARDGIRCPTTFVKGSGDAIDEDHSDIAGKWFLSDTSIFGHITRIENGRCHESNLFDNDRENEPEGICGRTEDCVQSVDAAA